MDISTQFEVVPQIKDENSLSFSVVFVARNSITPERDRKALSDSVWFCQNSKPFVTDCCTLPFCISLEMAETDEFNVEDQLNYEAETGEGGEGEGDDESADIGDDPELEAIKVCFMHSPNTTQSSEVLGGCTGTPNPHQQTLVVKVTVLLPRLVSGRWRRRARS